jgi:hypothetical protein
MTKLEALLRRLLLLRQAEPGVKALVFSQFPDALALASKAMDVAQVRRLLCFEQPLNWTVAASSGSCKQQVLQ